MLFTTNDSNVSMVANCGTDPGFTDPPLTLVQTFPVGDTIHAGDYDVIVTSITGQTSFSGDGYVKMSWLGDANVAVRFTNIGINTEKQLTSGVIETTYDSTESGIANVDTLITIVIRLFGNAEAKIDSIEQSLANAQQNNEELSQLLDALEPEILAALNSIPDLSIDVKNDLLNRVADLITQTLMASNGDATAQQQAINNSRAIGEELALIRETLEAEATTPARVPTLYDFEDPPCGISSESIYITPIGTPIKLPNNAIPNFRKFHASVLPDGTLGAFTIGDKLYVAKIPSKFMSGSGHAFFGYYLVVDNMFTSEFYSDPNVYTAGTIPARIILRTKQNGNCGVKIINADYELSETMAESIAKGTMSNRTSSLAPYVSLGELCAVTFTSCNEDNALTTYLADNKLKKWLIQKGISDAEIYLADCATDKVTLVTSTVQSEVSLTVEEAKQKVITKAFNGEYAVFACLGIDGKWTVETNFRKGVISPKHEKLKGHETALEQEVREQAQAEIAERNAISGGTGDGVSLPERQDAGDGEEFYKESMGIIEAVTAIYDFGKEIINEAKMPEGVWNKDGQPLEYEKSVFHIPSLMGGMGDQVIEEVTEGIQFVKLAYQCVRHPRETFGGLWQSVKNVKWEDVKKMAFQRFENYKAGGTIAKHQAGKDGVRVAMLVFGAIKNLGSDPREIVKNGGDAQDLSEKFDDLTDEARRINDEFLDETGHNRIIKATYDGDLTPSHREELLEEIKDNTEKATPDYIENFIKGKKYEKRVTSKIENLDDAFYTEAAGKLSLQVSELKGLQNVNQLQINLPNGNFFVADNAWVKMVIKDNKTVYEVIINETKLSAGTDWSKRQREMRQALQAAGSKFTNRSIRDDVIGVIPKNADVIIKSVIKTSGDGSVSDIFAIEKIF